MKKPDRRETEETSRAIKSIKCMDTPVDRMNRVLDYTRSLMRASLVSHWQGPGLTKRVPEAPYFGML